MSIFRQPFDAVRFSPATSYRTSLVLVVLLFLVAAGSTAQTTPAQGTSGRRQTARPNTWSARSSTGRTLMGTWTAVPNPSTDTATGTWTLVDAKGKTLMRGGWSAAKSRAGWTGAWRASVSGRRAEYSGTWSTNGDLGPDARFADLFERALGAVVSGNWQAGGQRGTWSIRAFN